MYCVLCGCNIFSLYRFRELSTGYPIPRTITVRIDAVGGQLIEVHGFCFGCVDVHLYYGAFAGIVKLYQCLLLLLLVM